jgi:hypothetical protein
MVLEMAIGMLPNGQMLMRVESSNGMTLPAAISTLLLIHLHIRPGLLLMLVREGFWYPLVMVKV